MTPRTFVWDFGMITWVEAYNLSLICIAVYNQVQTRGPIFNAVHSQIEIEKTLFQVSAYKCNCSIVSKLQDTNILVHWTTSGQPIEVSNSVFAFGKSFLIYINDSHFLKIYFKSYFTLLYFTLVSLHTKRLKLAYVTCFGIWRLSIYIEKHDLRLVPQPESITQAECEELV